jgi:hypothetical protein
MLMEYESQRTVGTCRGLLYCVRRKNGETKTIEVVGPGSNEYETTLVTIREVQ